MSDIDLTRAVEAAARAMHDGCGCLEAGGDAPLWASEDALNALTAALPHIREQIAREIESGLPEGRRRRDDWIQRQQPDRVLGFTAALDAIETCARIARGDS